MKNKTIQGVGCNDNNWALILSENRQLSVRTIGNFFRGIKKLEVYRNHVLAGTLTERTRASYMFEYDDRYFIDPNAPAISLTMPKSNRAYQSNTLFPFFFNMLSEGVNRKLQHKLLKIDEDDYFGLLAATAQFDTIGAITVKPSIL